MKVTRYSPNDDLFVVEIDQAEHYITVNNVTGDASGCEVYFMRPDGITVDSENTSRFAYARMEIARGCIDLYESWENESA